MYIGTKDNIAGYKRQRRLAKVNKLLNKLSSTDRAAIQTEAELKLRKVEGMVSVHNGIITLENGETL